MGIMDEWKSLVKSLGRNSEESELLKGGKDKTKLIPVQKQVTRNGKTFTQTVYVSPEEANKIKDKKATSGVTVDVQAHLRPIRKALGTEKYKEYLKAHGIKWEKSDNVGADTMRASMATKKWLEAGNKLDEDLYKRMLKGEPAKKVTNDQKKKTEYKVGDRITYEENGKTYIAEITGVSSSGSTVKVEKRDGGTDFISVARIKEKIQPKLIVKDVKKHVASAKNYDDLAQIAFDNDILMDLKAVPFEVAKDAISTALKIKEKIPYLFDLKNGKGQKIAFGALRSGESYMKKNWYACAGGTKITLNVDRYSDVSTIKASYERDVNLRWHPKGTDYKSIVTHELGHVVNNLIDRILIARGEVKSRSTFAKSMKSKTLRSAGVKVGEVERELSGYATANTSEFFAEAFAEWIESPNPRPVAKEFGRILMEEVAKIGSK